MGRCLWRKALVLRLMQGGSRHRLQWTSKGKKLTCANAVRNKKKKSYSQVAEKAYYFKPEERRITNTGVKDPRKLIKHSNFIGENTPRDNKPHVRSHYELEDDLHVNTGSPESMVISSSTTNETFLSSVVHLSQVRINCARSYKLFLPLWDLLPCIGCRKLDLQF